ncbi:hypothetical protein OBG91_14055 [Lactococcus lactis]|nr:hypothetical protein [Lactococcus lactis]
MKKNRALTVDEQARVSSNMKVIFESEADALKITGEKKNTLMKALNGDFNNMSKSQAQQVINDMRGMREQANIEYDQQAADQKNYLMVILSLKIPITKIWLLQNKNELTS